MVELAEVPALGHIAKAKQVLSDKGCWAREAETLKLLEQASAKGEYAVMEWSALMKFRAARMPQESYAVTGQPVQLVPRSDEADPMQQLSSAFICPPLIRR